MHHCFTVTNDYLITYFFLSCSSIGDRNSKGGGGEADSKILLILRDSIDST